MNRYRICANCGERTKITKNMNKGTMTPFCIDCAKKLSREYGTKTYHEMKWNAKLEIICV